MMKKLFLMTVAMFCAIAQDAWADNDPITYIERSWDEVNKRVVETEKTCYSYTLLSGNHSDWQGLYDGWYVVKDANVTYQTLNVLGNVHLILCDGARISLTGGMKLEGSRTLTIYGQRGGLDGEGSGTLDATNTDYDDTAGIGSAANTTCGNLIVHGGNVWGTGNKNAAGIGGGDGSHSGDITIYGGHVMAHGGDNAAGIGGGEEKGIGGTVNIYGGKVKTWGGDYGAGIGGGNLGNQNGVVNIYGGEIYAYGKYYFWGEILGGGGGAGIGGGDEGWGGTVNIYGGTVNAFGRGFAAGIGGGQNRGINGTVTISGGNVMAYGYDPGISFKEESGAGIGGGQGGSQGGAVIITGGYVEAKGGRRAAGIGGGAYFGGGGNGGNVQITGGTVVAVCGVDCNPSDVKGGSAIGCGFSPDKNSNSGCLELGKQMMVIGDGNKAVCTERDKKCRYSKTVRIDLCDHENGIVSINDGFTHTAQSCLYCDDKGHAESHVFGSNGMCCCGLLGLNEDADNTALLESFNGKTVSVALLGRTFQQDGSWNTLCLPFNIDNTADDEVLGKASVRTLNSSTYNPSASTLTLNFSPSDVFTIDAGSPYVMRWEESEQTELKNPLFRDVTISNHDISVTTTDYVDFVGTYSPASIGEDGDKTMLYLGHDGKLNYPDAAMNIDSFHAYFKLEGLTEDDINSIVLNFENGITTGITSPNDQTTNIPNNQWYTLDGRKLSGRPSAKGIYMNNGRKTVIR